MSRYSKLVLAGLAMAVAVGGVGFAKADQVPAQYAGPTEPAKAPEKLNVTAICTLEQGFDQWKRSDALANARAMHPNQWSFGARWKIESQSFIDAGEVFFAAARAAFQNQWHDRRQRQRGGTIGAESERRAPHCCYPAFAAGVSAKSC